MFFWCVIGCFLWGLCPLRAKWHNTFMPWVWLPQTILSLTLKLTNNGERKVLVGEWNGVLVQGTWDWELREARLGKKMSHLQTGKRDYLLGKSWQGCCQGSWAGGGHRWVRFLEGLTENRRKVWSSLWDEADKGNGKEAQGNAGCLFWYLISKN